MSSDKNTHVDIPNETKRHAKDNTAAKVEDKQVDILYSVDEIPPWYLCLFLGFQQFLTAFGATFAYPVIIKSAICIDGDDVGLGELISTVIFVSGISTLLQCTFGVSYLRPGNDVAERLAKAGDRLTQPTHSYKLPIIQSVSYSFITPTFVLMNLNQDKCPFLGNNVNASVIAKGSEEHKAIWKENLCELQGALMVASLLALLAGFCGVVGFLMRFIGPLTIAPTITLISLSLFKTAADKGSTQWYICFMTICLVAIFSQYLRNVSLPLPCLKERLHIFALFPVLLAIILSWIICVILTETNVLSKNSTEWGYAARTDTKISVLRESSWFRFPYPGQWGTPTVAVAGVLGMMAAVLASVIESVGDYHACARLAGASPPPGSAISRGIGMEGITCLIAGAWGAGGGNTSYAENIGAIGITKVGSRIVIQIAGIIMVILGCLGKFGALFVTIPEPVIGGLFFVMFGMVGAVGISNLQFVDLNSSRNLFVFGLSMFFGLSVPTWMTNNPDSIHTGNHIANQVIQVLTGTSMFVGGIMAFILDNTMPGTIEERGLHEWKKVSAAQAENVGKTYDIPFIQKYLNRVFLSQRAAVYDITSVMVDYSYLVPSKVFLSGCTPFGLMFLHSGQESILLNMAVILGMWAHELGRTWKLRACGLCDEWYVPFCPGSFLDKKHSHENHDNSVDATLQNGNENPVYEPDHPAETYERLHTRI